MEYPKEFDDIRPFFDSEVHDKMKDLTKNPVLNMPFVMYCATSTMNNSVKNY